jgi:hypothetical protein
MSSHHAELSAGDGVRSLVDLGSKKVIRWMKCYGRNAEEFRH